MTKNFIYRILSNSLLHHILFWGISFIVFANTFKVSEYIAKIDYIYSALFHISIVFAVYLNLLILIPKLFSKKKYIWYGLTFLVDIVFGILINWLTFNWLSDKLPGEYYFISYYNYFDLLKFFSVYLGITTLLKLSKSWFMLQEMDYRLTKIEKENINSELKALKAQINPHFLFNSLNLIYSLAIKNSKMAPEAIIQLSDILRYVTYDTKNEVVELKAEIKLVEDFMALQALRINEDAHIKFVKEVDNVHVKIPPMLFLPLIENSFKHGIGGDTSNTFVHIYLGLKGREVIFEIENNKGVVDRSVASEEGGIGLANIQKRLELLYQDNFIFDIVEMDDKFKVKMVISYED
jgi:sensor histidine kinase YesM